MTSAPLSFRRSIKKGLRRLANAMRTPASLRGTAKSQGENGNLKGPHELSAQDLAKLKFIAESRGQTIEETRRQIPPELLESLPRRMKDRNLIRNLDVRSVEVKNGIVELRLANGRVFYSYPSREKYRNIYNALKDGLPSCFTAESYQAGADAVARYQNIEPRKYFPIPRGGTVIEGGAFIGFKSVRLGELVGPEGKVVAIEIGKQNSELLRRNIEANGMGKIITPVHCGIWNQPGTMQASFEHATWYHLVNNDKRPELAGRETVPTNTLDNIIDECNLKFVDLLILQLNGAEYEALEGLDRRLNDVKIIRAAAYYDRNGVPQRQAVRELLEKKGCMVFCESPQGLLTAATPRFKHEFTPWPADKNRKSKLASRSNEV